MGNFFKTEFLIQPQQHHFALIRRQFLKRELQLATLLELRQRAIGRGWIGFAFGAFGAILHEAAMPTLGAPVIGQPIAGDLVQPGREACFGTIALARGDQAAPDILEAFLGQRRLTQMPHEITEQAAAMPCVQRLERHHVAAAIGEHQGFIRWLGVHAPQRT